jgi:hypothetical protein
MTLQVPNPRNFCANPTSTYVRFPFSLIQRTGSVDSEDVCVHMNACMHNLSIAQSLTCRVFCTLKGMGRATLHHSSKDNVHWAFTLAMYALYMHPILPYAPINGAANQVASKNESRAIARNPYSGEKGARGRDPSCKFDNGAFFQHLKPYLQRLASW